MNLQELTMHVEDSFSKADKEESNLSHSQVGEEILQMAGMSGKKWRHFMNNLASFDECSWVEVGTWAGSTFCSAICSNERMSFAATFDNSSQFSDVSELAHQAIKITCDSSGILDKVNVYQIKDDFRNIPEKYHFDSPIDVYYFDGPHDYQSQKDGITLVADILNKERCVILVDDWNWEGPRLGTQDALSALGRKIEWQKEIFTEQENGTNEKDADWLKKNRFSGSEWHNGVAIFVLGGANEKESSD